MVGYRSFKGDFRIQSPFLCFSSANFLSPKVSSDQLLMGHQVLFLIHYSTVHRLLGEIFSILCTKASKLALY